MAATAGSRPAPTPPLRPVVVVVAGLALAVAALVAGRSSRGAASRGPDPVPIGTMAARPNIVFVLADDLSTNLVRYMPHVRRDAAARRDLHELLRDRLAVLPEPHVDLHRPVPARLGVYSNTGPDGGYGAFDRHGDASRTFAVALQRAATAPR